jgi:hypothetical protein
MSITVTQAKKSVSSCRELVGTDNIKKPQKLKKQQQNNKETRSTTGGIFASIYNVFFSVIIQFNLMMVKIER